eukprot:gene6384-biopygen5283
MTSKLHDPLGMLSPVTLIAHLYIAALWDEKFGWDQPLPPSQVAKWQKIQNDLQAASEVHFPRWISFAKAQPVALHVFTDASKSALGVTAYLTQGASSFLLGSKSKLVARNKINLTIPQLELSVMFLGSQYCDTLLNILTKDFQSVSVHLWTRKLKQFVQSKVDAINSKFPSSFWGHTSSTDNPADLASRGCSTVSLATSALWQHGPKWLCDPPSWPPWPKPSTSSTVVLSAVIDQHVHTQEFSIGNVIDVNRFNSTFHPTIHMTRRLRHQSAACIRTANGHTTRSVIKLYPLELNVGKPHKEPNVSEGHAEHSTATTRPKRTAAAAARDKIFAQLIDQSHDAFWPGPNHKPLEVIYGNVRFKPSARIERWVLRLQPYDFKVQYRPGPSNHAVFLSRHPSVHSNGDQGHIPEEYINFIVEHSVPKTMTSSEIKEATNSDKTMKALRAAIQLSSWNTDTVKQFVHVKDELSIGPSNIILRGSRIVLPDSLRQRAIDIAHITHQGLSKTKALSREKLWFPNMDQLIKQSIDKCLPCQAVGKENRVRGSLPELQPRKIINRHKEAESNELIRKDYNKQYADTQRHAKESHIKEGDTVLVRQEKKRKLMPKFNEKPYVVIERKGVTIIAENGDKHRITRNISHFKKIPKQVQSVDSSDDDEPIVEAEPQRNQIYVRRSERARKIPELYGLGLSF